MLVGVPILRNCVSRSLLTRLHDHINDLFSSPARTQAVEKTNILEIGHEAPNRVIDAAVLYRFAGIVFGIVDQEDEDVHGLTIE